MPSLEARLLVCYHRCEVGQPVHHERVLQMTVMMTHCHLACEVGLHHLRLDFERRRSNPIEPWVWMAPLIPASVSLVACVVSCHPVHVLLEWVIPPVWLFLVQASLELIQCHSPEMPMAAPTTPRSYHPHTTLVSHYPRRRRSTYRSCGGFQCCIRINSMF